MLLQRLNEASDGELHHRSHLVFELRVLRRRKSLIKPVVVCFEIELGFANQKIRLTVTAERRQPSVCALEISFKRLDIGGFRGDDAPAEDADAFAVRPGRSEFI